MSPNPRTHDAYSRMAAAGAAGQSLIRATPFQWREPSTIPAREFLYGRHLTRRFISATVAPGGVGKSSLILTEALAMVTGRPLLGIQPAGQLRVWLWNGEDPEDEIERRVAACMLRHGIEPDDIGDRLFLDSGRTSEIILASTGKGGPVLERRVLNELAETIRRNCIDVLIIDPFISVHRVGENDNGAVDMVVKALNRLAEQTDCAVELVHHVRKGQSGNGGHSVDDSRGASALLAAARSARVLNTMTKEEAERAGVENHRRFFRVDNGKANLAPAPDRSEWFELRGVPLGNGRNGCIETGDNVAAVVPWKWPDPLANIAVADLRKAQAAVRGGCWREDQRAASWVGKPIAEALGITLDKLGTTRVKAMLRVWTENGMFKVVRGKDKNRETRNFVEVGEPAND